MSPFLNVSSALLIILLCVHGGTPALEADVPAAAFVGDARMGVCTHFGQGWDFRKFMPLVAKSGVGWIRDEVWWEGVETKQGVYHLSDKALEWIRSAHANHLRLLMILNGGNKLYADHYDAQAYAKWAAWMVKELGKDIDAIEILNEPNNFGFMQFYGGKHEGEGDSPWVAKYVTVMNKAAEAIKAVDSRMPVIGYGAGPAVTYRQLTLGVSPAVDGIVDHPYSNHVVPELVPIANPAEQQKRFGFTMTDEQGSFASLINGFRRASAAVHGPQQVWLTEWGYSTYQPLSVGQMGGFTEPAQAKYVLRRFVQSMGLGVEVSFLYDFRDDGGDAHNPENRWGLVRENGEPKESYQATANLAAAMAGLRIPRSGELGAVTVFQAASWPKQASIAAYPFVDGQGRAAVAIWGMDRAGGDLQPRTADVELAWGKDIKSLTALDSLSGKREAQPFKQRGRRLFIESLTVRDYPVLLIAEGVAPADDKSAGEAQRNLELFNAKRAWSFANGQEFPGATGGFKLGNDDGLPVGVVTYDFTGGGEYVSAGTDVEVPADAAELRFAVKSVQGLALAIRLIDQGGQCHQLVKACGGTGGWEKVRVSLRSNSPEHWGGANDGRIHLPLKQLYLLVKRPGDGEVKGQAEFAEVVTLSER